eukprot:CAMPEP_0206430232 /NCGR_PEP_ID=MMETSP0324_2-20121206/6704_1 /ASSEMBLY_ACC=CAM_ASM_000836 /TAXON_ID=2866 /ORGANISM="Crypthecodinium cohnii, Strain Seligo" /LENGTH=525 /DNA_ID=CAMNT_0053896045 /DNA_START=68 /DNA_END=1642 /DNA_ORIENTATION=-
MQKADLEFSVTHLAPHLMQLASGGELDDRWSNLFQEHLKRVMKSYANSLQDVSSETRKGLEVLRARYQIMEIVHTRVYERARQFDPKLADVMKQLQDAMKPLFDTAIDTAAAATATPKKRKGSPPSSSSPVRPQSDVCLLSPASDASKAQMQDRPHQKQRPPPDEEDALSPCSFHGTLSNYGDPSQMLSFRSSDSPAWFGSNRKPTRTYSQIHDPRYERERYQKFVGRPGREMTLEQLRDQIQSLLASKERSNRIRSNAAPEQPFETMEEHLYACLMRRHCDPNVVEQWALALFACIQKNSTSYADIAAFGKMLQNKLSENQVLVLDTLKETAKRLLQARLEERISEDETFNVEALWQDWLAAKRYTSLCIDAVVRHMYNDFDADRCMELINPLAGPPGPSMPDIARVALRNFREALLHFHMSLSEFFISDFTEIFWAVGQEHLRSFKGVLSAAQASEVARRMADIPEAKDRQLQDQSITDARAELYEECQSVLGLLQRRKGISFSECVDDLFAGVIEARWKARG